MSDYHTHPPLLKPSSAAVLPPIPTTHPFSDGNSTTSHQSETAASPSMNDNGATPPLRQQPPPPPRNASFPAREDCWSEDATSTLIEAWGDRFIELNRGNLRQKHWQDVADAVNHRHGHARKSRRSDIQCKNRIDTLKKKYKVEKSKVMELGANNYISPWPFFAPLDLLIGSLFKPSSQTPTPPPNRKRKIPSPPALLPPSSSVPVGRRSKRPAPPPYQPSTDSSYFRRNFSVMAAAAAAIDGAEDDYDSDTSWSGGANGNWSRCRSWSRSRSRSQSQNQFQNRQANEIGNEKVKPRFVVENDDGTSGDSYHQLAEAIGKFAEVYARVEEAKQKQIIELEKLRMQFTKDLELQRLKLLMESQMQLVKLKHFNRIDEEDHSTSIN